MVKATQVEPGKVVSDEAMVTVTDTTPAPTINTAVVGDNKISGTGINGAEVSIIVPWQVDAIVVDVVDGKWSIDVPEQHRRKKQML